MLRRDKTTCLLTFKFIINMAINYSVAGLKNPALQGAGEVKYYAKAQASGEVGIEQLAEEIAYATALTDGDVVSAIRALVNRIRLHIQEGKIVRLESLGSFQVQLRGSGAESPDLYTPAMIEKVRLQFRPGTSIKEVLNPSVLKFHKVPSKKTKDPETEEGTE